MASRKYLHSHSSLLSTTTSSSAESQNASPVLAETRPFYSPMMNDKRRSNCMPRRKLIIRTENALPDQISPPMTSILPCSDAETLSDGCAMWEPRRVRKQVSLPVDDLGKVGIIPPPVPPRMQSHVIRMPETRLVADVKGLSPPVPPKPKPRQKSNELFYPHRPLAVEQHTSDRPFGLGQNDKSNDSTSINNGNSNTGLQKATRRIIYSRVSAVNPTIPSGHKSIPDYYDQNKAARETARQFSMFVSGEHRVRDRRHSSADRNRVPALRDHVLPVQGAPYPSAFPAATTIPSLEAQVIPPHRASLLMPNVRTEETETPYVLQVPAKKTNTEPCERRQIFLTSDNPIISADQMRKEDRPIPPAQPDRFDWIKASSPESIRPDRTQALRLPCVPARRPQSIDRFSVISEPRFRSTPPLDPNRQANARSGVSLKRCDSETDHDARTFSRSVRRMSSHASTVSSGSNTLVSTSSEHIC
ncbi:hypothetical protein FBUS_06185 [Fasciolopsis buskii]|uniref:Uncharacterized protein n=1 Tax=Fasciolopsis buskii TaxID=27845 RepID=A0A8E0RVP1_9TREM|nr:hypothetical protein FBUS_06185 [Fasciolopsis buski]